MTNRWGNSGNSDRLSFWIIVGDIISFFVGGGNDKVGLKLNIHKTKIKAYGPITSWQIDRETGETVADLFWGAPKLLQMVTAAMKLKNIHSLEEKL